jgi:hypothetical protein
MAWAQKSARERLNHIGQFIAITPTLQSAIAALRSTYDAWHTRPEGTCLFLVGEPRVGKTTAIDELTGELHAGFLAEYRTKDGYDVKELDPVTASMAVSIETPTGFERPIIKVLVGSRPTYNELLADVLLCLGIPVPKRATFGERLHLLRTQLIGQKVRMVVFDEVQHISEHRGAEGAYKAADVFKVLLKATCVQIVCAGLPHALEIVDASNQIAGLTHRVHHIRPFDLDLNHNSELMTFLRTINEELPFDRVSKMAEPDVALRIALFSDLLAGRIALLTHAAVAYAIEANHPRIDMEVLATTLRQRYSIPDRENIFSMCHGDLEGYPELVRQRRQDRICSAENRQSTTARHKHRRKSFGARGQ